MNRFYIRPQQGFWDDSWTDIWNPQCPWLCVRLGFADPVRGNLSDLDRSWLCWWILQYYQFFPAQLLVTLRSQPCVFAETLTASPSSTHNFKSSLFLLFFIPDPPPCQTPSLVLFIPDLLHFFVSLLLPLSWLSSSFVFHSLFVFFCLYTYQDSLFLGKKSHLFSIMCLCHFTISCFSPSTKALRFKKIRIWFLNPAFCVFFLPSWSSSWAPVCPENF